MVPTGPQGQRGAPGERGVPGPAGSPGPASPFSHRGDVFGLRELGQCEYPCYTKKRNPRTTPRNESHKPYRDTSFIYMTDGSF